MSLRQWKGQWDGPTGKVAAAQTRQPEFDSWDQHKRWKEKTNPHKMFLDLYTCMVACATISRMHTTIMNTL